MTKSMTVRQVRDALNALPESPLLDEPARWWGVERGGTVKKVETLAEDYLGDDEYVYPRSQSPTENDSPEEDEVVALAGSAVLMVDD